MTPGYNGVSSCRLTRADPLTSLCLSPESLMLSLFLLGYRLRLGIGHSSGYLILGSPFVLVHFYRQFCYLVVFFI